MQLIPENDPRLKQNCEPFDFSTSLEERVELVKQMKQAMVDNRGVGLAAPQVGINKRVFVIEVNGETFPCFNPEIIESSVETQSDGEGCLSFPGLFMKVTRAEWVIGKFFDVNGNEVTKKFDGMAARCYQHELEHLNGICFTDVVSPLVLNIAKKRRSKKRKNK